MTLAQQLDIDEGYRNLAIAIVERALDDYHDALLVIAHFDMKDEREKDDKDYLMESKAQELCKRIVKFVHSGWYLMLTSLDGEMLLSGVRNNVANELLQEGETKYEEQVG